MIKGHNLTRLLLRCKQIGDTTTLMSKKDKNKGKLSAGKKTAVASDQDTNEIISMVAHELKNPLASIRGYTELLVSGAVGTITPDQEKFLRVILSNTDRMAELLADLSDAAKLDSGKTRLNLTYVGAVPILQNAVNALQQQAALKPVSVEVKISEIIPEVIGDASRLNQIFLNLVSNAIKYTPSGGKVTVSAAKVDGHVVFSVQDNGLGISTEDQKLIFSRYYRSEDVQARDIPGTGLGLYITRRLVEMQNGKIWFESELGKGTTFFVSVPY